MSKNYWLFENKKKVGKKSLLNGLWVSLCGQFYLPDKLVGLTSFAATTPLDYFSNSTTKYFSPG